MLYYTTKARNSALSTIKDLQKKIGTIPGNVMSYTDVRELHYLLDILEVAIIKEDKEATK